MRKLIWLASVLLAGAVLYGVAGEVQASRNSSGTYSLFAGTAPVTSLQTIGSSLWNNAWNDMAADMTLSLDRNGRGGMLAPLRSVDGTLAAPSFSFTSETGSGLFRNGAGDVRFSLLGSAKTFWGANGFGVGGVPARTLHVITGSSGATSDSRTSALIENSTGHFVSLLAPNAQFEGLLFGDVANNQRGYIQYNNSTSGVPDTMQLATGGTVRLTLSNSGATFSTGIGADGSGFKHKRFTGLCTTGAAAGAVCDDAVTWTTTFADANYTLTCTANGGSGVDVGAAVLKSIRSKAAAGFTIRTMAVTAGSASLPAADCIAVHD